jgi:hypothetical protein
MKLFKITVMSDCGTYFEPYLQSVTVIAETKGAALLAARRSHSGEFIRKPTINDVEELVPDVRGCVDYRRDTDY